MREWLLDAETAFEIRDEGLLRLFFCELLDAGGGARPGPPPANVVRAHGRLLPGDRRRRWTAQDDEVLRYGVELMEWNATWFARLEERLSQAMSSSGAQPRAGTRGRGRSTASAISEQSGWWPTVATGSSLPASARRAALAAWRRARAVLDAELGAGLRRDRRGLTRAHERAREDDGGWIRTRRAAPECPRLLEPRRRSARATRRAPRRRLGMPAEVDAHPAEHSAAPGGRSCTCRVTSTAAFTDVRTIGAGSDERSQLGRAAFLGILGAGVAGLFLGRDACGSSAVVPTRSRRSSRPPAGGSTRSAARSRASTPPPTGSDRRRR